MSAKNRFERFLQLSEDFIYVVIALLLIAVSLFLIFYIIRMFFSPADAAGSVRWVVGIVDQILLLLMVIEILYTVRVSYRKHSLDAEPFLIVALIAAIRRILVISVESAYMPEKFNHHMIEMSILGGLIFIFVFSLIYLRRQSLTSTAEN